MFRNIIATLLATLALSAFAAVDVNQASQAELESVKGIGPGLSGKIVEARKGSAFKDWGDFVERVSGIGPGNAARFSQAGLTVAGSSYAAPAADAGKSMPKADRKSDRKGEGKAPTKSGEAAPR